MSKGGSASGSGGVVSGSSASGASGSSSKDSLGSGGLSAGLHNGSTSTPLASIITSTIKGSSSGSGSGSSNSGSSSSSSSSAPTPAPTPAPAPSAPAPAPSPAPSPAPTPLPPSVQPTPLSHDFTLFATDLSSRLRAYGLHIIAIPATSAGAGGGGFNFDRTKALPISSVPATSRAPSKVHDLRDKLKALQDKTHQNDLGILRGLGVLGFPELVCASVQAGSGACKDAVVASYALQSVGNLAMEAVNRQRFADLGAIELVIDAMRCHNDGGASSSGGGGGGGGGGAGGGSSAAAAAAAGGARVQKDAIVALRHLVYENDASKRRLLDAGGVEAVVEAMTAFSDNPQVQRQACGAISLFAVHSSLGDAPRARVVSAGGVLAILGALKRWHSDPQLMQQGVKSLLALVASPEARVALRDAGVVRVVEEIAEKENISLAPGAVGGGDLAESLRTLTGKIKLR